MATIVGGLYWGVANHSVATLFLYGFNIVATRVATFNKALNPVATLYIWKSVATRVIKKKILSK